MTPQNEAEYYKRVSNFEIYNCKEMKEEMVNWISEQSAKVSLFSNPIKNITGSWWFDYHYTSHIRKSNYFNFWAWGHIPKMRTLPTKTKNIK